MPRYHLSSVDGTREPGLGGVELPDDQAAHAYAVRFAGGVLQSEPSLIWKHGRWRVEVVDDDSALLFTVIVLIVDAPPRPLTTAT